MKTKDLVIIALYSVLITISTQIKIPLAYIPMTLQVFTISLGALILSRKQILLSLLIFVFIAFIGVAPIAGNVSGPQIFVSPTFPYIIGFFILAYNINKRKSIQGLVIGYISFYAIALPLLYLYFKYIYLTMPTVVSVITVGFVPFIITDTISIALAYFVSKRIKLYNY